MRRARIADGVVVALLAWLVGWPLVVVTGAALEAPGGFGSALAAQLWDMFGEPRRAADTRLRARRVVQ